MHLGVNIDHVATLRNARKVNYPNVLEAAYAACRGGADRITVHLREDRRHIKEQDVLNLTKSLKVGLNLEIAPLHNSLRIIEQNEPYSICVVPEKREELTTEGGLDLLKDYEQIASFVEKLRRVSRKSKISLFLDPALKAISTAAKIGVDIVEIHTGTYANGGGEAELDKIRQAAAKGVDLGLAIHAGHGLHMQNTRPVSQIKSISELNIGHSLISDSIFYGLETAVRNMKELIN